MQYNQPYGESDPNAPYVNGDPSVGRRGSIPPAASIEYPQRELVNFFSNTGMLTPDNADLNQLSKAVMTGMMHHGVDVGAKNLLSVLLTPAPDKYYDGMFIFVIVAVTNDGPSTINVNGLGPKNIVRRGGGTLVAGDLPATFKSLLCFNKAHNNFELYGVNFAAASGFLPVMTANTTWYVNASTGDDTVYDGTSPTISGSHGPFKTIQRAVNEIFKYGPSVYQATVQVAAGTYPEAVTTYTFPGPGTTINGVSKASVFVSGANNRHTMQCAGPNSLSVTNIACTSGTGIGPPSNYISTMNGNLYTNNCASYGTAPYAVHEAYNAFMSIGNHQYNAGSQFTFGISCVFSGFGGYVGGPSQTSQMVFTGSCAVVGGGAYCICWTNGTFEVPSPWTTVMVNAGYLSGMKFSAALNGVIATQGQGVNYFPGNVAGVTSTGGWYQ